MIVAKIANAVWVKTVELSIIVLAGLMIFSVSVAVGWALNNKPLFVEFPDKSADYVVNPEMHAGSWLITRRMLKRTDDCAVSSGIWLLNDAGEVLYHIDDFTSYAPARSTFAPLVNGFYIHPNIPPGHYWVRAYVSCQRNPLSEANQRLRDLPFDILPPEQTK